MSNRILHRGGGDGKIILPRTQLGGDESPLADAIIDRIAHGSYMINITSIDPNKDISMREVYGLAKNLRE